MMPTLSCEHGNPTWCFSLRGTLGCPEGEEPDDFSIQLCPRCLDRLVGHVVGEVMERLADRLATKIKVSLPKSKEGNRRGR